MIRPPSDADADELPLLTRWQPAGEGCPSPDLLFAAVEGALPREQAEPIRAHVERCPLCRELATVDIGDAAGPTLQEGARLRARIFPVATVPSRRWTSRAVTYAAAAAVALVAGGVIIARLATRPSAPAAPTQAHVVPAPAPAQPEFVLALNKPVTELPLESLTLRSASADPYAVALEKALKPYERGDYAEAARQLEVVSRDNPSRPHPAYYLGLSKLLGKNGDAVADFERARTLADKGSSLRAEAAWYLAVALERTGRRESAASLLTDLCGSAGPHQAEACAGQRALTSR